jgi:hypothetical protein
MKFTISVPAAKRINCSSNTKTNWLILFREIIAVYCESDMTHVNTVYGKNTEHFIVKAGVTYTYTIFISG